MHRSIILLSVFLTCLFGLSQQTTKSRRDISFDKYPLSGSGDKSTGVLSGVTFEDDEDLIDGFSGSGSGSGEGSTKDGSDMVIATYVATINISSQAFVPEMADKSSTVFISTAKRIEHDLEEVFRFLPGDQKIVILSFRQGSLMTTFSLEDTGNNHPAEPRKVLMETLKNGRLGDNQVSMVGFEFEPRETATTVARMTPTTSTTTSRPLSECEKMRETRKRLAGSEFLPRCTPNGEFEALQCIKHAGTDDCWCSDLDGVEIPGSRMESPNFPACDDGYNMSPCVYALVKHIRSRMVGTFRPRCALDGQYDRVQCRGSICYCVDESTGDDVEGTQVRMPAEPNCDDESTPTEETETVPPAVNKWVPDDKEEVEKEKEKEEVDDKETGIIFPGEGKDSIAVEGGDPETDNKDRTENNINININKGGVEIDDDKDDDKDSKEDTSDEEEEEKGPDPIDNKTGGSKSTDTETRSRVEENQILTQPGLLGGIIGGAVVLLLGLVLLIMFIVYRMRKKDEGSYPLDEPRKTHNYSYVRAPEKEYYA